MSIMVPRRLTALTLPLATCMVVAGCDQGELTAPVVQGAVAEDTSASRFQQVSTGLDHACATTVDGRVFCWGLNLYGQLGDGTTADRLKPTAVIGGLLFRNISAGDLHTCGVTADSLLYCWGDNQFGQLGNGTVTSSSSPIPVAGGRRWRAVSAGRWHTCALSARGLRVYCWGDNSGGQLGDGTTTPRLEPVLVASGHSFRLVEVGAFHSCALTPTNQAFCWGKDTDGVLGDGPTRQNHSTPSPVAGGLAFSQISAGEQNTCATTTDQRAFCWGRGPTGDGKELARYTPRAVASAVNFNRITVGSIQMCALSAAGKAYCWGFPENGNIGDGSLSNDVRPKPVAVLGGHTFAQLSAGGDTCAKTKDSVVYCWGSNFVGQIGDGTTQARSVPTRVLDPSN